MKTYVAGAALLVSALALPGCGGAAKKVALKVNQTVFTDEEFNERVQNIDAVTMLTSARSGGPGKAGEVTVRSLVYEALIGEMAAAKKISPTDKEIDAHIAMLERSGDKQRNPFLTDSDRRRDAKSTLMTLALMAAPLNLKEEDYKQAFEKMKPSMTEPEQYHIRMIDTKSKARADEAIKSLATNITFETVVAAKSDEPNSRGKGGDIGFVPAPALKEAGLYDVISKLKPGEYTKTPVSAKMLPYNATSATMPKETRWFVIKLEEMKAAKEPTIEESRPALTQQLLAEKDPGATQRFTTSVKEAMQKADIQINIKSLEKAVADLKKTATAPAPGGPGATGAPPVIPGG